MRDLLDEAVRLDEQGAHQTIAAHLCAHTNDPVVFLTITAELLKQHRFAAAGHLAHALLGVGIAHPVAHLARAIAAELADAQELARESTQALAGMVAKMTAPQRQMFGIEMVTPALFGLVTGSIGTQQTERLLRVLEILKAGVPRFAGMFDFSPQARVSTARETGSLLRYQQPPQGASRVPYRIVVAMRERVFPHLANSRLLDIGPRFAAAAQAYGWPARFLPLHWVDLHADLQATLQACRDFAADVVILDDEFIGAEATHPLRRSFVQALRQACPGVRLVANYLDAWSIPPERFRATVADTDVLWTLSPGMAIWSEPEFAGKVLHAPLPHPDQQHPPSDLPPQRIRFVGGLMGYNWHRLFWRASSMAEDLPIDWDLSSHMQDGLAPLESFAVYMRRLRESGCVLNMAMRSDLSGIVTGRAFETLLGGSLLVQEDTPDLDAFFTAGTHYLPFASIADLRAIVRRMQTEPDRMQSIRAAGHDFAVQRYADDKLFSYLDGMLFF